MISKQFSRLTRNHQNCGVCDAGDAALKFDYLTIVVYIIANRINSKKDDVQLRKVEQLLLEYLIVIWLKLVAALDAL